MATQPQPAYYTPYGPAGQRPLPKELLPTMYDLPDEEEDPEGMPDIFHVWQSRLLDETFSPPNYPADTIFTACDLNLYYNVHEPNQNKRPDWFAVVGLPPERQLELRRSYVMWQEKIAPLVVVELLSPSTLVNDLGLLPPPPGGPPSKWEVYERWVRVPYYLTFSRHDDQLRVFKLAHTRYEEVTDHQGRCWIEEAELGLGLWQGNYQGHERLWLRCYDRAGNWLPNAAEQGVARAEAAWERAVRVAQHAKLEAEQLEQVARRAAQERRLAEQERRLAEQERQQAEQLLRQAEQVQQDNDAIVRKAAQMAAKLRELGLDPEQLP